MSWLLAPLYDVLMRKTEAHCLGAWRKILLGEASGRVLEIGGGTGVNLEHYPDGLEQLIVTEPDPGMKKQLDQKFQRLTKPNLKRSMPKRRHYRSTIHRLIQLFRPWFFVPFKILEKVCQRFSECSNPAAA